MKLRESVAAIITYGAGTASGKTSLIVSSSSANASSVGGHRRDRAGLVGVDHVDPDLVVVDRLADVVEHLGHVSPTMTRMFTPAVAVWAITLSAGDCRTAW